MELPDSGRDCQTVGALHDPPTAPVASGQEPKKYRGKKALDSEDGSLSPRREVSKEPVRSSVSRERWSGRRAASPKPNGRV